MSGALVSLLLAYALGCVSFAALVARLRGIDIRAQGSGNPGATNIGRVLGKGWGLAVLLLDVAKGLVPVLVMTAPVAELVGHGLPGWLVDPDGRALVAAAAVLGHIYPVTSAFRGGKGVATLLGASFGLDPLLALAAVVAHLLIRKFTGYVSLASVVLVWLLPVLQLVGRGLGWDGRFLDGTVVLGGLALVITLRHRDNFRRIRAGTEDKYDESNEEAQARTV